MPPATDIPGVRFDDATQSARNLAALHEAFVRSGTHYPLSQFGEALECQLRASPDPDLALTNLLRFSEASLGSASLFTDLVRYPVIFETLMKIFGFSRYFADIIVRDPELFRWLTATDVLAKRRSANQLHAEVIRLGEMFHAPARRLDALRRLYRREVLHIGARDILGIADLPTVTASLSDLADSMVQAAMEIARLQLEERYAVPPPTPMVVIGLGKLGGRELNYSSDIDILAAYRDDGLLEESSGRQATHQEYFHALVERTVRNLSGSTAEGHLYRVDTRLRPESGAGPLARSLGSFLTYYESRGELWERQMLIKARPVAGDIAFGDEFLAALQPFVYPRTFFERPTGAIAKMKARIEATIGDEDNIKLQSGGIRDIEFIVQALQLLNGGKNPDLRIAGTLPAVEALGAADLLGREEQELLHSAYLMFRTLEHRLQFMQNTQTHVIPHDEPSLTRLAKKMGFTTAGELRNRLRELRRSVRAVYDATVGEPVPAHNRATGIVGVIQGGAEEGEVQEVLRSLGFRDLRQAARHLRFLISGSVQEGGGSNDVRVRETIAELAGVLFDEIAATPLPDITLKNLTLLASSQALPRHFAAQWKEPAVRTLLVRVAARSPRIMKGFAADPLLLETILSDPGALREGMTHAPVGEYALFKRREEIRAATRFVLGLASLEETTSHLSDVAGEILAGTFTASSRAARYRQPPLSVFALGKFGTREMGYDADLDILFVSRGGTTQAQARCEKLAARIVQSMTGVHDGVPLYDVDTRLRPEGKNAPLVIELEAYVKYLATRASLWERQSLTRLRFVCGNSDVGEEVPRRIREFVYGTPLPAGWVEEIVSMRRRTESRSRVQAADFHDFKLGPGGLVDIEFLTQMLLLQGGADAASLHAAGTAKILALAELPEAGICLEAYRVYREIEMAMRLTLEERGSVLPEGEKRSVLAAGLGYASGEELGLRVAGLMRDVRAAFLSASQKLPSLRTLFRIVS